MPDVTGDSCAGLDGFLTSWKEDIKNKPKTYNIPHCTNLFFFSFCFFFFSSNIFSWSGFFPLFFFLFLFLFFSFSFSFSFFDLFFFLFSPKIHAEKNEGTNERSGSADDDR